MMWRRRNPELPAAEAKAAAELIRNAARVAFDELADKWGQRYPAIVKLWDNAWEEFIPFLDYDVEIRKVICSTNAIESLNARYRRAVQARGSFPERTGRPQVHARGLSQATDNPWQLGYATPHWSNLVDYLRGHERPSDRTAVAAYDAADCLRWAASPLQGWWWQKSRRCRHPGPNPYTCEHFRRSALGPDVPPV